MTSWNRPILIVALFALVAIGGCQSAPRNLPAVHAYYDYRFADARAALRRDVETREDEQILLNAARLGLASLADGDPVEAERALGFTFDLLSTAGLNRDRTVAAVMTHEGVRIWKGEPFEQALMYYWTAALYATMDDWENARAAAANALFRLSDFGESQRASSEPAYTAVDSNFALGFLMQAIGSDLSGAGGAAEQFDAALAINPSLEPIVNRLRQRDYDTLLLVDYGKGPTKMSFGRDSARVRYDVQEHTLRQIVVTADGDERARLMPVTDVNRMATDHRWNNLERVRIAKSQIGDAMVLGGAIAVGHGSDRDSAETQLAGLGLILAGFLSKSGAKADTRYLEFAPQSIYLVPLRLETPQTLHVGIDGSSHARMVLPDVTPGTTRRPRTIYLRLHGRDSRAPNWLSATTLRYGNDLTGVWPGDYPWILGGRDVSTPSESVLRAYQDHGYLLEYTLEDLLDLYRAEGIVIGSGMEPDPDAPRNPAFRHILEGGQALFTPMPWSMGYKRLMYHDWPAYQPKSDLVRDARRELEYATGGGS